MTVRNRLDASALLVIFLALSSCEYVRPTLNDRLVRVASDLILRDAEFQRLMADIQEK